MYWRLSQGCRSRAIGSRDKYRCTLVQRYPGVTFFRMRMPSMAREAREACEVCRDMLQYWRVPMFERFQTLPYGKRLQYRKGHNVVIPPMLSYPNSPGIQTYRAYCECVRLASLVGPSAAATRPGLFLVR